MKCDVCKQNIATLNRCRDCNSIMMNVVKEEAVRLFSEKIDNETEKYLEFVEMSSQHKTRFFEVWSKSSKILLGVIKWNISWRNYTFFPTIRIETVYSDRCMMRIGFFIQELNESHKQELLKQNGN